MPKLNTPMKIGRYLACTVEQLFKVIIIGALFLQLIEKISCGEDQEGHLYFLNLNVMYLYMCVHCDLHAFPKQIHELDEDDDIAYTIKCKFFYTCTSTCTYKQV